MTNISPKDWNALSAYLDNALKPRERQKLETRLRMDPQLQEALTSLKDTCRVLRATPKIRPPRNFTLTPEMVGIRPRTPRTYPTFRLAFALASILFIFAFIGDLTSGGLPASLAPQPVMELAAPNEEAADSFAGAENAEPKLAIEMEMPAEAPPQMDLEDGSGERAGAAPAPAIMEEGEVPQLFAEEVEVVVEAEKVVVGDAAPEGPDAVVEESVIEDGAKEAGEADAQVENPPEVPTPTPEPIVPSIEPTPERVPLPSFEGNSFNFWRGFEILFGALALLSGIILLFQRRQMG